MATIVSQIITAAKAQIATTLGATYSELAFEIDLEKNNFRSNDKRYGFIPLEAANNETSINRYYTLDHRFNLILTQQADIRQSDADLRAVREDLYDKMDELFQAFILTKLGLSSIIMLIDSPEIEAPEYLEDNRLVVLRGTITIKYRQSIN